jgi:hypothetical protein
MLLISVLSGLCLAGDLQPSAMEATLAKRDAALDKLVLQVEVVMGNAPAEDPFDSAHWTTGPSEFHRITIARPTILDERLDAAGGRVTASHTIREGTIVRKSGVADPDGTTRFSVTTSPVWSDYHGAAGAALLQWLDLSFGDAPEPWTNVRSLLAPGSKATLLNKQGDAATYSATTSNNRLRQRYELTLDERGTPRLIKTSFEYLRDGAITGTAVYEQHTRETAKIGDFELPVRSLFISRNPAVEEEVPALNGRVGVVEIRVTGWSRDASLRPENVGHRVGRKAAIVIETDEHGNGTRTKYDETGRVVPPNERRRSEQQGGLEAPPR